MKIHCTEYESVNPPIIKREYFIKIKKSAEKAAILFFGIEVIKKWNPKIKSKLRMFKNDRN